MTEAGTKWRLHSRIEKLEQENARLEDLIYDILTEIPETYLTGYSDWGDELKRLEQEELLKANKGD